MKIIDFIFIYLKHYVVYHSVIRIDIIAIAFIILHSEPDSIREAFNESKKQ